MGRGKTLDMVSTMIAVSWGKTMGTIVSSTLQNRGDKMTVPVHVAVKC